MTGSVYNINITSYIFFARVLTDLQLRELVVGCTLTSIRSAVVAVLNAKVKSMSCLETLKSKSDFLVCAH